MAMILLLGVDKDRQDKMQRQTGAEVKYLSAATLHAHPFQVTLLAHRFAERRGEACRIDNRVIGTFGPHSACPASPHVNLTRSMTSFAANRIASNHRRAKLIDHIQLRLRLVAMAEQALR
jgi:hypothetical protein